MEPLSSFKLVMQGNKYQVKETKNNKVVNTFNVNKILGSNSQVPGVYRYQNGDKTYDFSTFDNDIFIEKVIMYEGEKVTSYNACDDDKDYYTDYFVFDPEKEYKIKCEYNPSGIFKKEEINGEKVTKSRYIDCDNQPGFEAEISETYDHKTETIEEVCKVDKDKDGKYEIDINSLFSIDNNDNMVVKQTSVIGQNIITNSYDSTSKKLLTKINDLQYEAWVKDGKIFARKGKEEVSMSTTLASLVGFGSKDEDFVNTSANIIFDSINNFNKLKKINFEGVSESLKETKELIKDSRFNELLKTENKSAPEECVNISPIATADDIDNMSEDLNSKTAGFSKIAKNFGYSFIGGKENSSKAEAISSIYGMSANNYTNYLENFVHFSKTITYAADKLFKFTKKE